MSEEYTEYRGWIIYKQQVWSGVYGYYAQQGTVKSPYFPSLTEVKAWVDAQIGGGAPPDGTPESIEYRGWIIYRQQVWSGVYGYYAEKGTVKSPYFPSLTEVKAWVDAQILDAGGTGTNPDGTPFSPDRNQWVGCVLPGVDDARENKLVALGPAPPGLAGKLEGVLLVLVIARLSKTPEGMKILNNWGVQYLKAVQAIITGIATSSSANALNCIFNGYLSVRIYQRMGLISAHDAIQTAAWFDHCFAELLKKDYFNAGIGGLTTLVNATSETGADGEKAVGLASLAKLFARGAVPP